MMVPPNPFSEGMYIVVDKPVGWTSFDVVNRFRRLVCKALGVRRLKVGHAGTLDPLATGVVVLCTGRNTKKIDEIQSLPKTYTTTIELGATTPSFDLEYPIDAVYPTEHITAELVNRVLDSFRGEIDQVPPAFSAVKVDGDRAYRLARQGIDITLTSKKVTIYDLEVESFALPQIGLKVVCSKGTYIRSLARDLGQALGSGAHLTALRRTRVGHFTLAESLKVEELAPFVEGVLGGYNQL